MDAAYLREETARLLKKLAWQRLRHVLLLSDCVHRHALLLYAVHRHALLLSGFVGRARVTLYY